MGDTSDEKRTTLAVCPFVSKDFDMPGKRRGKFESGAGSFRCFFLYSVQLMIKFSSCSAVLALCATYFCLCAQPPRHSQGERFVLTNMRRLLRHSNFSQFFCKTMSSFSKKVFSE